MATNALGPTLAGGMQPIVENGFELIYLPDIENPNLQSEGKPPVFYYVPNQLRIARKNGGEDGDLLFNLIRFNGLQQVQGSDEQRDVAGGVLTFTITGQVPDQILKTSQEKILSQWNGKQDHFWGIRTRVAPIFRPAIVTSNVTTVSSVSPTSEGGVPTQLNPAVNPDGGGTRALPAGRMRVGGGLLAPGLPRTVPVVRDATRDPAIDPWFWRMQGQGPGSIDPTGQNAFSAMLGAYPTAIVWEAFHGTASPIVVNQALMLKVWSPVVDLRIRGHWDKVFEHFSAHFHAHYLFASVDLKAEFNKMRQNGTIEVDLKVDSTLPNADEIAKKIDQRSDLVFQKFMDQAMKVIFEPPQPNVPPAEASGTGGPWGVGLAMKYRRDTTSLNLEYHETRQLAYNQPHVVSSSLEGLHDEIKADPAAEKKYFLSVDLTDWPRTLARIVRPVVNWPETGKGWAGQPVAFVSCQLGYPNAQGEIKWEGKSFQDNNEWKYRFVQKQANEVANAPAGWQPDLTFVKRKVHLLEPDDSNPLVAVQIDQNTVDLDPEPNGSMLNDVTLEVRADSAGKLLLGPIDIAAYLEDQKQTVEVTFEHTDDRGNPSGRPPVRFKWQHDDQSEARYWSIFSGDPETKAFFRYKVRVVIKGSLLQKGMEWEGPWVFAGGNGPLTATVPTPDEAASAPRLIPHFALEAADGALPRAKPAVGELAAGQRALPIGRR